MICCASASVFPISEICIGGGRGRTVVTPHTEVTLGRSRGQVTYVIHAQQAIAGLDATRLIDRAMQSHVRHDQRIIGTATQCQAQTTALPLHGDLCQFRGNIQTILGNCCNETNQYQIEKEREKERERRSVYRSLLTAFGQRVLDLHDRWSRIDSTGAQHFENLLVAQSDR